MADKPTKLPKWADQDTTVNGNTNVQEPPNSKKNTGWENEVPNAQFQNWFQRIVYRWIQWLNDATTAATPDKIQVRKSDGRGGEVEDGSATKDPVNFGQLSNHTSTESAGVHGSTINPTPEKLQIRQVDGRGGQIEAGTSAKDPVNVDQLSTTIENSIFVKRTVYDSPGSFTHTLDDKTRFFEAEIIAGGGSAPTVSSIASGENALISSGGGGGAGKALVDATDLDRSFDVSVGNGGSSASESFGENSFINNVTNTSGSLYIRSQGGEHGSNIVGTGNLSQLGGVAGTGVEIVSNSTGQNVDETDYTSSIGGNAVLKDLDFANIGPPGSSVYGGRFTGLFYLESINNAISGSDAIGPGEGGQGGFHFSSSGATSLDGANGGDGLIIITEYMNKQPVIT